MATKKAEKFELSDDAREWLEAQCNEFMEPYAEKLSAKEAKEFTDDPTAKAGWYSRLSAPGYMDCTEWQGPYSCENEAFEALYDTFAE